MERERENVVKRLRLVFEDDEKALKKWQRKSGLNRSWISLKPSHATISDVVLYLIHSFQLHHTSPNCLILSMDGYVLPPFESTSILKDKDVISVKRKRKYHALNFKEKLAIVEKQPVNTGLKLLANREFQKETGGYESESEDDEPPKFENVLHGGNVAPNVDGSRKRKAPKELKRSKKKKDKYTTIEETLPVDKDGIDQKENGFVNGDDDNISFKEKNHRQDVESSNLHQVQEKSSNSETEEDSDNHSEPSSCSKRLTLPQENIKSTEDASHTPGGTKKGPSRNARRKKAKRQWLREMAKISKIEPQQRQLFTDNQLSSGKKHFRATEEHQRQVRINFVSKKESHQSQIQKENVDRLPARGHAKFSKQLQQRDPGSKKEDDIVPVVICPGHIRFEPHEEGQSPDQNQVSNEKIQWNGITSKKKGLKWGTQKVASSKSMDCTSFNQGTSGKSSNEQSTNAKSHIDFNKLPPCATFPKEGDVIAYRLIELSSTWTPELSSYRVGLVTQFNTGTKRITLEPVPEFPIDFETKLDEEGSLIQPDTSLYANDGSLVIGFSSLIELRIVKSGHANAEALSNAVHKPVTYQNTASGQRKGNGWEDKVGNSITWDGQTCEEKAHSEVKGWGERNQAPDGNVDAWEQSGRMLNVKNEQLSQNNYWRKKDSGNRSWSSKALRGSALGPTVATLRVQKRL